MFEGSRDRSASTTIGGTAEVEAGLTLMLDLRAYLVPPTAALLKPHAAPKDSPPEKADVPQPPSEIRFPF